jgi:electron transfer flavoprotein alpha/beta subunit
VKAICLVKQVPTVGAIEFDEETKTLKREGVPLELNLFDRYAVQHAAALGDEVIAMTMGPPQAEEALRECLALGADRCIHLSDRVFAVADTLGTARTLALAIRKEGADVVICGRKSLDSETWQVPPEVAGFLGWPHVTSVIAVEPGLRITRETDEGEDVYEIEPPVVLSVAAPTEAGSNGREGPIDVWQATDLVDEVHPNDKRFGQTGSPTRVLAVRDSRPERKGARTDSAEEAARIVTELLSERAPDAPSWEKPGHVAEKPGRSYDCWSVVELVEGRPRRVSLELLARGRELAGKLGGQNVALVMGHRLDDTVEVLRRHGAEVVHVLDDQEFAEYHPERWAAALRKVLLEHNPRVVLIPATAQGRDFGPRAAGELELGMTGDCVGVDIAKAGRLLQQKPAFGGNIVSVIMGSTTPQLATVRPRMYEPLEPREGAEAEVKELKLGTTAAPRMRLVDRRTGDGGIAIDEADIVLCGGEGVDLSAFARDGVAIGGSARSAAPRQRKIGLLGRPVAPLLYVGVGVEDEPEHWAGAVKSRVIVAVGKDAPAEADVSVSGDFREILPTLLDSIPATR